MSKFTVKFQVGKKYMQMTIEADNINSVKQSLLDKIIFHSITDYVEEPEEDYAPPKNYKYNEDEALRSLKDLFGFK